MRTKHRVSIEQKHKSSLKTSFTIKGYHYRLYHRYYLLKLNVSQVLKQHPEKHVCFFSQLFLHWTTKYVYKDVCILTYDTK